MKEGSIIHEEVDEGHHHKQHILSGGEVIFYLHKLGGAEGARVAVEERCVPFGSTNVVPEVIIPHAITVVGAVGGLGARYGSARDGILTCSVIQYGVGATAKLPTFV